MAAFQQTKSVRAPSLSAKITKKMVKKAVYLNG
jgi:hypothetical protein